MATPPRAPRWPLCAAPGPAVRPSTPRRRPPQRRPDEPCRPWDAARARDAACRECRRRWRRPGPDRIQTSAPAGVGRRLPALDLLEQAAHRARMSPSDRPQPRRSSRALNRRSAARSRAGAPDRSSRVRPDPDCRARSRAGRRAVPPLRRRRRLNRRPGPLAVRLRCLPAAASTAGTAAWPGECCATPPTPGVRWPSKTMVAHESRYDSDARPRRLPRHYGRNHITALLGNVVGDLVDEHRRYSSSISSVIDFSTRHAVSCSDGCRTGPRRRRKRVNHACASSRSLAALPCRGRVGWS
jgi:hypothetical protein